MRTPGFKPATFGFLAKDHKHSTKTSDIDAQAFSLDLQWELVSDNTWWFSSYKPLNQSTTTLVIVRCTHFKQQTSKVFENLDINNLLIELLPIGCREITRYISEETTCQYGSINCKFKYYIIQLENLPLADMKPHKWLVENFARCEIISPDYFFITYWGVKVVNIFKRF